MSILRTRRQAGGVLTTLGLLVTLWTNTVAESGYSTALTLRTGPAGAAVRLWDIAAARQKLAVIWEERLGDRRVVRLRTSTAGGRTFRGQRLVDDRGADLGATDVCAGSAWVAKNFRLAADPEGSWGLAVHGLPLRGMGRSRQVLVESGRSHNVRAVDLACAGGRRRVVAWADGDWEHPSTIRLRFLPVLPGTKGVDEVEVSFRASAFSSVAVAGVRDRIWATWVTLTGRIRIVAFDIGPAPGYAVTRALSLTLPEAGQNAFRPTLGAAGSRVIIAYSVESGTYARVSTDGGSTFGPRRRLLRGEIADVSWLAFDADIRGRRAVVHAGFSGGMEGEFSTDMYRYRSFDDGRSWSRVRRSSDGVRMGAFSVRDGAVRLVEAWDQSTSSKPRKWLRFQRELEEHSLE
jgi:hypothetical protein